MLDAPQLPACSVHEGPEGKQLGQVIGRGWILGIPAMFAVSLFILFVATHSVVWMLLIAAWGAVVAGPYFGGFVLLNRAELAADHEADLEVLVTALPAVAHPPAA